MKSPSFCINIRSFAIWIGCILFAEHLGSVCFRSAITTIERRYSLPSTTIAILTSGFQIGSVPVLVLVSYYGSRYHRPRSIAIGCALMCIGFLLMTLPQFLGSRYEFIDISLNDTSRNTPATICEQSTNNITCDSNAKASSGDKLYLLILLGLIICGVGSTPVQPLGFSYIDDHAAKHNAAIYIGFVTSIGLVAPALGFVLGSFVLKLWVDIGWIDVSEIEITPYHPGWVGAWWIGILISVLFLFTFSFSMWFYPKKMEKMPEKLSTKENDENNESNPFSERVASSLKVENGNILTALKRLMTNPRYLLVVLLMVFEMFRISGLSTFSLKYYEVIFGKSASISSLLVGAINLPALVVGTVMGSYAIKRWKLNVSGIAKLSMISLIGSFIIGFPEIFIGCDTTPTAGVTVPYPANSESGISLSSGCNAGCECDDNLYAPVCGPGGITYVTPCHAGCSDFSIGLNGKIENYTQCSCVDAQNANSTVSVGRCPWSYFCSDVLMWILIALKTIATWFAGLHATPLLMLLMRSLKKEDKAFGIGLGFFLFRLLGLIPGPIVFGYAIDQTCLYWMKKPCSDRFYCNVYDNVNYRYSFFGLCFATHILAMFTSVFYYVRYAKKDGKRQNKQLLQKSITAKQENSSRSKITPTKGSLVKQNTTEMPESFL